MSMRTRWVALFLIAAPLGAGGQPPKDRPPPDKKDPQSAIEPRSGPGAGQKFLERFVGDWDVVKTFHPRQGEPVTARGSCRQTMIHGGRFLQSEFTFDGAGGKTTGTGTIGFETDTGLFTSSWVDSRSTRMSLRRSTDKFDGTQIVLFSRTLDEGGREARQSRTVTRLDDDGRKIVHRQYSPGADGQERLMMELVMTRKPEPKAGRR
jgi:Protein of unknown function (DUF1579)